MCNTLRFAPSPTGMIHVGNLRAALLNFLFAKKTRAKFILRIDDTDKERSKQEFIDQIFEDLKWLGLSWDETFAQSERIDNYNKAIKLLEERGFLYKCYETKEELDIKRKIQLSQKRPPVYDRSALKLTDQEKAEKEANGVEYYWRFKLNQKQTSWHDMIHGDITVDTASISDPIIEKANGSFLYILASVIDDIDSKITHIIRGDDHIANTAVQIQMFEALNPEYKIEFGHYPLLQSLDGDEFSKRNNSMSINWFKENGVEAMSLNSIMAKLGTSDPIIPHTSMSDLIDEFSISKISKARPKFDLKEVFKINKKILAKTEYDFIKDRIPNLHFSKELWDTVKSNIDIFNDIREWVKILEGKDFTSSVDPDDKPYITKCISLLEQTKDYDKWINLIQEETKRSGFSLYHPIRMAITGKEKGPDLKSIFSLLGYDEVLFRLKNKQL